MENLEVLIAEKKAQIQSLRSEIKELQTRTLSDKVDAKILGVGYRGDIIESHFSCNRAWENIKKLGFELVRGKHRLRPREHLPLKDLTADEVDVIADMATEMIEIWNKYVKKIYGKEKTE